MLVGCDARVSTHASTRSPCSTVSSRTIAAPGCCRARCWSVFARSRHRSREKRVRRTVARSRREPLKTLKIAALVSALVAAVVAAHAGESISLILNWTPAADHSPFYYAKAQGWYEKAGIDLN